MAPSDWSELERISRLIDELHQRRLFADRVGDSARARRLAQDIITAQAERNRLVDQITARVADAG